MMVTWQNPDWNPGLSDLRCVFPQGQGAGWGWHPPVRLAWVQHLLMTHQIQPNTKKTLKSVEAKKNTNSCQIRRCLLDKLSTNLSLSFPVWTKSSYFIRLKICICFVFLGPSCSRRKNLHAFLSLEPSLLPHPLSLQSLGNFKENMYRNFENYFYLLILFYIFFLYKIFKTYSKIIFLMLGSHESLFFKSLKREIHYQPHLTYKLFWNIIVNFFSGYF